MKLTLYVCLELFLLLKKQTKDNSSGLEGLFNFQVHEAVEL